MSVAGDLIRGHTEAVILARLVKGDSYGYEISRMVLTLSGGQLELKEATLYTAFRRLEQDGFILSYWGEGSGARRRYYAVTPAGREECNRLREEWTQTRTIMDTLLEGDDYHA